MPLIIIDSSDRGNGSACGRGVSNRTVGIHTHGSLLQTGALRQQHCLSLGTLQTYSYGEGMYGLLRLESDIAAGLYRHTLGQVANGLRLTGLDSVKERRNHGIHKLGMAGCILMVSVRDITVSPLAVALVDGTQHIG